MSITCNHAPQTQKNYEMALRKYCEYFNMTLPELLNEAEEDEKKDHFHLLLVPNTKVDTVSLQEDLIEIDPNNMIKMPFT